MAPWEEYSAVKASGPWDEYAVANPKEEPKQGNTVTQGFANFMPNLAEQKNVIPNLLAGGVRGAGSIGATLIAPWDIAKDAINGKGLSLESNRDRRTAMDNALQMMGADPQSGAFQAGKLGTEVAGTLGVGGAAANTVARVAPKVAEFAPSLLRSIESAGTNLGKAAPAVTFGQKAADMGTRIAGGGINGGLSAGLVNPEDAGFGAAVGGLAPPAIKAAQEVMRPIVKSAGDAYAAKVAEFGRNREKNAALQAGLDAGYQVQPNLVKPSVWNSAVESFSGKDATAQYLAIQNSNTTDKMVRQALGLPNDVPLSKSTLESLRKDAGKAYAEVSSLSPQAASDLEALKTARNESQGWFKSYNRSASPEDLAKAKAYREQANQLESSLEQHAKEAGKEQLIPQLRDARKEIAKAYTVERALNTAAGTVDARVIGRMFEKGVPLSDGLDTVGRFASMYPAAVKNVQQIGSPGSHNLRAFASVVGSAAGGASGSAYGADSGHGGEWGVGGTALGAVAPWLAGVGSRKMMFRPGKQMGLLAQQPTMGPLGALPGLLGNSDAQLLGVRALPVLATQ